jgi:hypothetical protein
MGASLQNGRFAAKWALRCKMLAFTNGFRVAGADNLCENSFGSFTAARPLS